MTNRRDGYNIRVLGRTVSDGSSFRLFIGATAEHFTSPMKDRTYRCQLMPSRFRSWLFAASVFTVDGFISAANAVIVFVRAANE